MYSPPWYDRKLKRRRSMSPADERLEELRPFIARPRAAGCSSARENAAYLNSVVLCASRGRTWGGSQILRALRRLDEKDLRSSAGLTAHSGDTVRRHIVEARAAGYSSLRDIAGYLNSCGVLTSRGSEWHPTGITRVLRRLDAGHE